MSKKEEKENALYKKIYCYFYLYIVEFIRGEKNGIYKRKYNRENKINKRKND